MGTDTGEGSPTGHKENEAPGSKMSTDSQNTGQKEPGKRGSTPPETITSPSEYDGPDGELQYRSPLERSYHNSMPRYDMNNPWQFMPPMYPAMPMPMPMYGMMPPAGACGPAGMASFGPGPMDSDSDSDTQSGEEGEIIPRKRAKTHEISSSDEEEKGKGSDKGSDSETDFLAEYKQRLEEQVGPEICSDLASVANGTWEKGRDPAVLKDIVAQYKRPKNVDVVKTDVNEEVLATVEKYHKNRDMQLRSIQGAVTAAAIPLLLAADLCKNKKEPMSRRTQIKYCMDSFSLLAQANSAVNKVRRQNLKGGLKPKFQSLCDKAPDKSSKLLFGDDMQEKIKTASQAEKIGKSKGSQYKKGRYNPYHQGSYSGYGNNYQGYGQGYQGYGRGRRNQPFLGETSVSQLYHHTMSDDTNDDSNSDSNVSDMTEISVVSCRSPVPQAREREARQQLQERKLTSVPEQRVAQQGQILEHKDEVGEYVRPSQQKLHAFINIRKWQTFIAGRVSQCFGNWKQLTSDRKMLSEVRGLSLEFEEPPVQDKLPREIRFSADELAFLRSELVTLLDKKVIRVVEHEDGEFISNVFLRQKKDKNKFRMILNLKELNKQTDKRHFKMDTLMSTLALITPGCEMLSIDFQDAYYSCAMNVAHRKYLRFQVDGVLYEFTCLPNGLSAGPRFFTKLLKIPLSHLRREHGMVISGYLDDQIIVSDSYWESIRDGRIAAELFQSLGFMINVEKSVMEPTRVIEHLGFVIDSEHMTVSLTVEKARKILDLVADALAADRWSIRQVARLLGKLAATYPANPWAALFTKQLEIEKNNALAVNGFDFDGLMKISNIVKDDLVWWQNNLENICAPIRRGNPDYVINTDASLHGWGAHDPQTGQSFGGRWDHTEDEFHINYLELLAVYLTIQTICRDMTDKHVRIMTDNTTALACINKQGSVRSNRCNEVARKIWKFARDRNLWLTAAHCPGVLNVEADRASREFNDELEWSLNDDLFQEIVALYGKPDIDLFASRLNHKVAQYCSWQPDPGATYVDAFTQSWGGEQLVYAFPPFAVLPAMFQKFLADGAEGVVIVPFWPTKPWFSVFTKLLVDIPCTIPVTENVLYLPFREQLKQQHPRRHPLIGQLELIVGRCSSRPAASEAFRLQLQEQCQMLDEDRQPSYMNVTWGNGRNFVVRGARIPSRVLSI